MPQGSVLRLMFYLLYTTDLPVALGSRTATYADTAILAAHNSHIEVSSRLQESLHHIQRWFQKWRIKANRTKSVQVTFTTRRETCPLVTLNGQRILQADEAKYLGIHLDRRLNWKKTHIYQAQTTRITTGENILAIRQKITTVD